ncbi:uncharacterized protein V6R79_001505 [Siganus canaliculatus]
MLPAGEPRRSPFLRAAAFFCDSSAAVLEAVLLLSRCGELLLSMALALAHAFTIYLSAMLRLNTFLRLWLAGVLLSHDEAQQRWSCSTWPSSQPCRQSSSCPLRCGGGGALSWGRLALHTVPALCRCSLSVCVTLWTVIHVAPSALSTLCSDFRPSVSIWTFCGSIRPLLSSLHTDFFPLLLGIV